MSTLPDVQIGDAIRHGALSVFPLFGSPSAGVDYLLSDEAISAGSVTVEEVSEGGSVPNLLVTNQGDSRVLFLEGEELRRSQQDPDPGQLRRTGSLALSLPTVRTKRIALIVEASPPPEGIGLPLLEGGSGAFF